MNKDPNSREYILTNDAVKLNSDIQKFVNKNCIEIEDLLLKDNDETKDKLKFEERQMFDVMNKLKEIRDLVEVKANLL